MFDPKNNEAELIFREDLHRLCVEVLSHHRLDSVTRPHPQGLLSRGAGT